MKYKVGDTTYIQRRLVIGQTEELIPVLRDITFPTIITAQTIMDALAGKLPRAIAIVLREEGVNRWWERDIDALAERFRWEMDPETCLAVITDFFACNPVASLIEQFSALGRGMISGMETALPTSSASSPAATSPKKKRSGGPAPSTA